LKVIAVSLMDYTTAYYFNKARKLVIRQQRWPDHDACIFIAPDAIAAFLNKLTDTCGVPSDKDDVIKSHVEPVSARVLLNLGIFQIVRRDFRPKLGFHFFNENRPVANLALSK
jgi:hypothetical protein